MLAHVSDEDAAEEGPQFARNIFRKSERTCFGRGAEFRCFVPGRRTNTFAVLVAMIDGTASHGHLIWKTRTVRPFSDLPGYRREGSTPDSVLFATKLPHRSSPRTPRRPAARARGSAPAHSSR